MTTETDKWGEAPEDVLLCLYQNEAGYCSKPFGHEDQHDVRPAFCCAQRQACVSEHDGDYGSAGHAGPCCGCEVR